MEEANQAFVHDPGPLPMAENLMLPPPQEWTIQPDGSVQVLPPPGEGKAYVIHDDLTYEIVETKTEDEARPDTLLNVLYGY